MKEQQQLFSFKSKMIIIMCIASLTAFQTCQGGDISTMMIPTGVSITLSVPTGVALNDGLDAKNIHLERQSINAVTQDDSWYAIHGSNGNPSNATEDERISTHLNYVRKILEEKDTKHLSKKASANRKHMLNVLNEYTANRVFPTNIDESLQSRTPIFIDQNGVSCAVGHLILNSEDEKYIDGMAALNEKFSTAYLMDIFNGKYGEQVKDLLLEWAEEHGFEPVELAMIQPSYEHMRPFLPRPLPRPPFDSGFELPQQTEPQTILCVNTKMKKILCPSLKIRLKYCKHAGRQVYVCKKANRPRENRYPEFTRRL